MLLSDLPTNPPSSYLLTSLNQVYIAKALIYYLQKHALYFLIYYYHEESN